MSKLQINKPIIAGATIDLPASPAYKILQIILPVAINTTTAIPIQRLRFQNASPNAVKEMGTSKESMIFSAFISELSHCFSNSRNSFT